MASAGAVGDVYIAEGEWHRIKMVDSLEKKTYTVYVDEKICMTGMLSQSSASESRIILGSESKDNVRIMVDNLEVTERAPSAVPSGLAYTLSCTEYDAADGVAEGAENLKLYFTKPLNPDSIDSDSVTVYLDGRKTELTDIFYNEGEKCVVAVPAGKLTPGAEGEFTVGENAEFDDSTVFGRKCAVTFKVLPDKLGVKDFALMLGGEKPKERF